VLPVAGGRDRAARKYGLGEANFPCNGERKAVRFGKNTFLKQRWGGAASPSVASPAAQATARGKRALLPAVRTPITAVAVATAISADAAVAAADAAAADAVAGGPAAAFGSPLAPATTPQLPHVPPVLKARQASPCRRVPPLLRPLQAEAAHLLAQQLLLAPTPRAPLPPQPQAHDANSPVMYEALLARQPAMTVDKQLASTTADALASPGHAAPAEPATAADAPLAGPGPPAPLTISERAARLRPPLPAPVLAVAGRIEWAGYDIEGLRRLLADKQELRSLLHMCGILEPAELLGFALALSRIVA